MTAAQRREVELAEFFKFKRMKTVFCHADHSTDEVSSIFNVQFDKSGRFIISGADDGILKVWDRDTLTLQASLHGHLDFITDIDVSKCNRFVASAGKDAQVIIWDLKMGRVVKRLTSHQSLINRLLFVAPRVPTSSGNAAAHQTNSDSLNSHQTLHAFTAQGEAATGQLASEGSHQGNPGGPASSYVKDQFLLTCSDDGTVHLYDFSPLSRMVSGGSGGAQHGGKAGSRQQQSKADYDEMRVRRSGRRSAADEQAQPNNNQSMAQNRERLDSNNNEVFIFEVELTPDDYRPGTRNKKLDAVACSSAGIVIAGTSTGEIFSWKLNFNEISRRNKADSYKYLGQFKICKNAGVQFAEFSPSSDFLMTGSTDGSVKIWRLDIPQSKSQQQAALKTFSMGDDSRLVVTIDEKNGCIKTNSISYFDEEGAENFEYVPVKQPVSGQIGFGKLGKDVKFSKSQCDAIKWSVRGRFAIASITSQIEDTRNENAGAGVHAEEFKEEVCRIKIWDTVNETFYDDLARPCGHQLKKNSWVLAPHPIFEELLMTGSDGGTLILWNIEQKQIIQKFSQYGVYSIDGYVRDNPLDGKFSCDGKAFIVGNQLGTISLFSCEPVEHQYEATRVQQFFLYDRARNSQNPFERIENRPQICGYNMIPHEAQPARPLIGRFPSDLLPANQAGGGGVVALAVPPTPATENLDDQNEEESKETLLERKKAESKAFERKLITAKELGHLEEKYYQHQLSNCLQESYQPNVLEQGNQLDAFVESSIDVPADGGRERVESGYDDQSLVNALSPPRRSGQSLRGVVANPGDFQSPASQNVRSRAQASAGPRRSIGAPGANDVNGARGQGANGRRRLVRRSDRALRDNPGVNGYDESEELVVGGFHDHAMSPQSLYHGDESHSDEDSASDASDLDSSPEVVRQRFQVRRTNVHEQQHARQEEMEEEQANRRTARLARRNEIREPGDNSGMASAGRRTAARGAQVRDNSEINIDIDLEDDAPMMRRRGRGRPSNAEREQMRQYQERQLNSRGDQRGHRSARRIIDDDSVSGDATMQDEQSRPTRSRLRQNSGRGADGSQQSMGAPNRRGRAGSTPDQNHQQSNASSTRRLARRVVDNSSHSRSGMDDQHHEERKGSPTKAEKTHNQVIRESGYFLSDREDASAFNFDMLQPGVNNDESHEKVRSKKVMSSSDQPGTQPDEDYSLVEGDQVPQVPSNQRVCSFCMKVDEPLVGPFCKYEQPSPGSTKGEQGKLIGQPLFFHQDCIEMNQYSKFCLETKKWVNIGTALQNLVHREQFSCFRCQSKGATVQCRDCSKAFHGFKCARMYTLQLGDEENGVFYQCIFCRNTQNWEDRISELTEKETERQELEREGLLHEKSYLKQLRSIEKQHLLNAQGYEKHSAESPGQSYNPQVNDFVFYFFQGHEYFMSQYSCHFFCGQLEKFARHRFMPWYKNPRIKKREFVRCRVESVEVLFPSQRSLNLISMYGDNSTQVTQTPEIIQRITLSVIDSTSQQSHQHQSQQANSIKFQVDLFPNQLADFLIPQAVFTEKYERYVKALQSGIVDKTFKVFLKDQNTVKNMRIIAGNSPVEPTLYPNSLWQNIKCVEVNPGRSGHGRVNEMPQHRSSRARGGASNNAGNETLDEDECERVSFWDIQFGGADEVQAIAKSMHVFVRDEKIKLVNTLKDFMEKKKEYIECFLDRVPVEVAPDYRSIIPAEMYFNLIKERLNNCYYRSQEQLLSDIDLISYNAKIYNGEHHDISLNAKELCEIIRVKLKQAMFTKSDTLLQQQMAQAGKLTVPSRTRTALQQKSIMDEMRNSLHSNDNHNSKASDPLMIELPQQTPQVQQQQQQQQQNQLPAGEQSQQTMQVMIKPSTETAQSNLISSTSTGNHQAVPKEAAAPVEESKNGVKAAASEAQPEQPAEEEKKQSGGAAAAGLIRINLGAPSGRSSQKEPAAAIEEVGHTPASELPAKSNRRGAQPKADDTPMSEQTPQQPQAPAANTATAAAASSTSTTRPSNNMSRRRNRINANLLAAEELEEKTKTDALASVAPQNTMTAVATAEANNNATNAVEQQEAAGATTSMGSSSMRLTRNRKRQRNE